MNQLDIARVTIVYWLWIIVDKIISTPDSKVHGANMGPIWGRQDPGGPNVGAMNFAIGDLSHIYYTRECFYNIISSNTIGVYYIKVASPRALSC